MIKIMNSNGPKTDPCEMPDSLLSTETLKDNNI